MKNGIWVFLGAIGVVVAGLVAASFMATSGPSTYDDFAKCLKESGATFYGAFWCPHCQATKRMFGSAAQYLPYVECSTPNGQGQLAICKDKGIQTYPTWTFANSTTTLTGERTMAELAAMTSCTLPQ